MTLLREKFEQLSTRIANERGEVKMLISERDKLDQRISMHEHLIKGMEAGLEALDGALSGSEPAARPAGRTRQSPGAVAEAVMRVLSTPPHYTFDANRLAEKTGLKAASCRAAAKKLVSEGNLVATADGWTLPPAKKHQLAHSGTVQRSSGPAEPVTGSATSDVGVNASAPVA